MELQCVIIEDDDLDRELLKLFAGKMSSLVVAGVFTNALDALSFITKQQVDLIISDIEMPGLTGLQMVRSLPNPPIVIFTTTHPQHAVESFDVAATDFLVKPIVFERFVMAINRAINQFRLKTGLIDNEITPAADHFFVRSDHASVKIFYADIIYLESMKDYLKIVTDKGTYSTALTLKAVEEKLGGSPFLRIHRSFIVNTQKIEFIKNDEVKLGKYTVPLGENYRDILNQKVIGDKILKR